MHSNRRRVFAILSWLLLIVAVPFSTYSQKAATRDSLRVLDLKLDAKAGLNIRSAIGGKYG